MSRSFRLLRKLAKQIKYLPLELLWNYPIAIDSITTLEHDIRAALGKIVPPECSLLTEPETAYKMLVKYDFLDLTFRVPDYLLLQSNYQSGISLLRQLLPAPESPDKEEIEEEIEEEMDELMSGLIVLEMLADDVDKGMTLCRMRLESQTPRSFTERVRMNSLASLPIGIVPNVYFPHRFTIRDACLTNASNVWFYKYFYL